VLGVEGHCTPAWPADAQYAAKAGAAPDWRTNRWVPVNYIVCHGLRRYGYTQRAGEIAEATCATVKKLGPREYHNTETVTGAGLDPFWGWTLLAYFMPIEHAMSIDPTRLEPEMSRDVDV
jgi:putative isomerase